MKKFFLLFLSLFSVLCQSLVAQAPIKLKTFEESINASHMVVFNNVAYFSALTAENGLELWRSDGTVQGTYLLKDINPGTGSSEPYRFAILNESKLLFFANDNVHGIELWSTDGTEGGTQMVKDINPGSASCIKKLYIGFDAPQIVKDGVLFFIGGTSSEYGSLIKSDGTDAGTFTLKAVSTGCTINNFCGGDFRVFNDKILLKSDLGNIWETDGTVAGTKRSIDLFGQNSGAYRFYVANDQLFITRRGAGGTFDINLWVSDGTLAGTKLIKDYPVNAIPREVVTLGDKSYFQAQERLWETDGTELGTNQISDLKTNFNSSHETPIYVWDSSLLFLSIDATNKAFVNKLNPFTNTINQLGEHSPYVVSYSFEAAINSEYIYYNQALSTSSSNVVRIRKSDGVQQSFPVTAFPAVFRLSEDKLFFRTGYKGPSSFISDDIWVMALTSSNKTPETSLNAHIFPNPSSDGRFYATAPEHTPVIARVFDALGKLVLQQSFTGNTYLQVPDPIPGIYYVHLIADDGAAAIQQVSILR